MPLSRRRHGSRAAVAGLPLARSKSVAQLVMYEGDSTAAIAAQSGTLGDFMAGAPAVASRKGPDGRRVAILPLPADDRLVILDADNGAVLRTVALGVLPIASVIAADGATAWVSVFGGPKPCRVSAARRSAAILRQNQSA